MEWKEQEHPRDKDGKFTDKNSNNVSKPYYRQNASYSEILAQNKEKTIPQAYTEFNRLDTKNHVKHAQEMGYNLSEYAKAAADFFNSNRGKLFIDRHELKYYRYEESTRLLAIVDENGIICSFYKAETKKYFERKRRQLKLYVLYD